MIREVAHAGGRPVGSPSPGPSARAVEVLGLHLGAAPPPPRFLSLAECGLPSPADDRVDRLLSLDELVVQALPVTYLVRVAPVPMSTEF
jgi:hypothetical protein